MPPWRWAVARLPKPLGLGGLSHQVANFFFRVPHRPPNNLLQEYIERPLLAEGRKFHLRAYAMAGVWGVL